MLTHLVNLNWDILTLLFLCKVTVAIRLSPVMSNNWGKCPHIGPIILAAISP